MRDDTTRQQALWPASAVRVGDRDLPNRSLRRGVLYGGPSLLDGAPIVVVATDSSKNPKTGDMVQVWIMRAEVPPLEAAQHGADTSICGECPLRLSQQGGCYVQPWRAPTSVWRAWHAGRYPDASKRDAISAVGEGRAVRLGAYGDPAAVPDAIWRALISKARTWTAYTRQWRTASWLCDIAMASCDTPVESAEAHERGWRTFRIRRDRDDAVLPGEIICPGGPEGGRRSTCERCGLCRGTSLPARSIALIKRRPVAAR